MRRQRVATLVYYWGVKYASGFTSRPLLSSSRCWPNIITHASRRQRCCLFGSSSAPEGAKLNSRDAAACNDTDDADLLLHRCMDECWSATSWTQNAHQDPKVDHIWRGLVSPAPQSFYVLQRAILRSDKLDCCMHLLKDGRRLVLRKNHLLLVERQPLTFARPGIDWNVVLATDDDLDNEDWSVVFTAPPSKTEYTSVTTLAHEILDTLVDNSDDKDDPAHTEQEVERLLRQLQERLHVTLGTDIRGRAAADAAFALVLAGVSSPSIYNSLYRVIRLELERVLGNERRQNPRELLTICEKVAASGALAHESNDVKRIYELVAEVLSQQPCDNNDRQQYSFLDTAAALLFRGESGGGGATAFDLLHPRPLLWLWRFSSRLTKPQLHRYQEEPAISKAWTPNFSNNHKPLVVDVGCGLGVSLLGLACSQDTFIPSNSSNDTTKWSDCNFLGGDANPLTTRFATGIAQRWQSRLGGNENDQRLLQYITISTEDLLDSLAVNYPGRVALVLLQFPTPFRIKDEADGNFNTQLPDDPTSQEFMASPFVLRRIARILNEKGGKLLVQSNCEDVAVQIRDMAVREGLRCVPSRTPVIDTPAVTERTKRWLDLCNTNGVSRAVGSDWWAETILPCQTETEAACEMQGTQVHRLLFEVDSQD